MEPVDDCFNSFPPKVIDEPNGEIRPATRVGDELLKRRSPRKDDLFPTVLPESLIDAIECFILSISIRLKRRPSMVGSKLYNPHNTMLIHVSRFTDWQNRTKELVQVEVNLIVERIGLELPSSTDSIYAKLERTWNRYYAAIIENIRTYLPEGYSDEFLETVTFEEIKSLLPEAVKGLDIKAINSVTKDKLVYTVDGSGKGKSYIAIGGNRLSRGFTLEGLSINYFIRDTNYADTLLQMGRWFGYRPGYIDCCKLFTTWDAIEKFNATTLTIEELEQEFKKMHRLGKTPDDFVLRVRNHPGVLQITRPSILKNAVEVKWSYQDTLVQTTEFELIGEKIDNSWNEIKNLFRKHKWETVNNKGFYVVDTNVDGLFEFLNCSNTFHEYDLEFEQVKKFIEMCRDKRLLENWKIAVKYTGRSSHIVTSTESGLPGDIQLSIRSAPTDVTSHFYKQLMQKGIFTGSGKSANIISGGLDMSVWLTDIEIEIANNQFIKDKTDELVEKGLLRDTAQLKASQITRPERIYRERMSSNTGLLVIYLMDLGEVLKDNDENAQVLKSAKGINTAVPLIGYAIGFPKISPDPGGYYMKGNYNIEEDEPESDEFDEELNANLD